MFLNRSRACALAVLVCACAHVEQTPTQQSLTPEAAWTAWRGGDAEAAQRLGEQIAQSAATGNEGHHIAALAAHARGAYEEAVAHFDAIVPAYPRRRELRGAIFESYLHLNRAGDALAFAAANEMSANASARAQARLDHPISVAIPGVIGLGFEDDALTPLMPGVAGRVNGRETVFRFDTGGTFVNMSPALAERFGVRSSQCAQGFANLQSTDVCFGVADIDLGPVRVTNAPVAVVSSLPAEAQGVALGPVLGTNFLSLFFSTIDAPSGRLLLSPRGHAQASAQHLALLGPQRTEVPFLLWSDHFMLARGGAGERRDLTFFVDSGLVAVAPDGVQAGLLVSQSEAAAWSGLAAPAPGAIVEFPHALSLGGAMRDGQRAMILPDASWAAFGTFGGIGVNGLISYGLLKHYAWTIDFDRRVIVLSGAL